MCLGHGTLVLTAQGYLRVEDLRVGQMIWTKDHGMQPLLAVVTSQPEEVVVLPKLALGNRCDLTLSRQHRIYLQGACVQLFAGLEEAFAVASHLVGLAGLRIEKSVGPSLYNLLFAKHEVILADGLFVESLYVSPITRLAMGKAGRQATVAQAAMVLAHPELSRATARAVLASMVKSGLQNRDMVA
jgi:hypothetical protein